MPNSPQPPPTNPPSSDGIQTPRPSYDGRGISIPFQSFWALCLKSRGQLVDQHTLEGNLHTALLGTYAYCSEAFFNRLLESAFGPTTIEKASIEAEAAEQATRQKRLQEEAKLPRMVPAIGLPPTLIAVPGSYAAAKDAARKLPADSSLVADNSRPLAPDGVPA